jgi:hypothetical protein
MTFDVSENASPAEQLALLAPDELDRVLSACCRPRWRSLFLRTSPTALPASDASLDHAEYPASARAATM